MLTTREIFDKVKTHLLTQRRRAKRGISCYYRAVDEHGIVTKCAIGCLISDETYNTSIEGSLIDDVSTGGVLLCDILKLNQVDPFVNSDLLNELQKIHDQYIPSRWEAELNALEKAYFEVTK